jgi:hypothetical protein
MSKIFLWSAVGVVISLVCVGGVAASRVHSSPTGAFATSPVSIDPSKMQATIKGLPEQEFVDLI